MQPCVKCSNKYNLPNLLQMDKLYSRLQEVEDKIKEEDLRIKDMKAQVLKNDHTIKTMLGSIVRPANR